MDSVPILRWVEDRFSGDPEMACGNIEFVQTIISTSSTWVPRILTTRNYYFAKGVL
jgi:hypothetical protein